MSYNTDLQENNAALEEILETVNNLPDSGGNVDWDQNDETAPDYVKNRTHYCESTDTVLVDEEITVTDQYYEATQFIYRHNKGFDFSKEGFIYDVSMFGETVREAVHNATTKNLRATFSNGVRVIFEENFVWSEYPDGLTRPFTTDFKIVERLAVYHPLDERYIPETIARTKDILTDEHINGLIDEKLAAMPNAAEVAY